MDSMKEEIISFGKTLNQRRYLRVVRAGETAPITQKTESVCQHCKGAGYVRANVPFGHPQFGKALECECKMKAQKKAMQEQLIADSGILSFGLFEEATFETFDQALPGVFDAVHAALKFADAPVGWLILVGPYGCGKTHLAVSIAKRLIDAGRMVMMQTVPDLLDDLRVTFAPHSGQDYSTVFEQMRNVDVLILDDYGAQSDTPWAMEKLFQLLNHRYNKRLATVVTSNDLKRGDMRLYSRMHDRRLVQKIEMDANDYRVYGDMPEE